MYNWDTAVCVCMVGTKMCDGSSHKLMYAGALSLLPFKGGANRFPESVVTLWDMGSPFYSKCTLVQYTLPSSLTATKYKVCQYVGGLWQLYSILQESSALHSYFEIQQRMWTFAVTCCADCIRLLAGGGMNICHEVWSLSTVMQPHTVYSCCSQVTVNFR
jgi:hypothetical protein